MKRTFFLLLGLVGAAAEGAATAAAAAGTPKPTFQLKDLSFAKQKLQYPAHLPQKLTFGEKDSLEVTIGVQSKGEPFYPEQVVLRLAPASGSRDVYFEFSKKEKDASVESNLKALIDFTSVGEDEFNNENGTYAVSIIISDRTATSKYEWNVGEVDLTFIPTAFWLAKQAASEAPRWTVRPLIVHKFRAPEKRAPSAVALAVTIVVIAVPWLFLLASLSQAGLRLTSLSITESINALVFHGILAVMVGVLGLYWIKLTIFPAIGLLVGLWIVAFLFRPREPKVDTKSKSE